MSNKKPNTKFISSHYAKKIGKNNIECSKQSFDLCLDVGKEQFKKEIMDEIKKAKKAGAQLIGKKIDTQLANLLAAIHARLVRELVNMEFYKYVDLLVSPDIFIRSILADDELAKIDLLGVELKTPDQDEIKRLIDKVKTDNKTSLEEIFKDYMNDDSSECDDIPNRSFVPPEPEQDVEMNHIFFKESDTSEFIINDFSSSETFENKTDSTEETEDEVILYDETDNDSFIVHDESVDSDEEYQPSKKQKRC